MIKINSKEKPTKRLYGDDIPDHTEHFFDRPATADWTRCAKVKPGEGGITVELTMRDPSTCNHKNHTIEGVETKAAAANLVTKFLTYPLVEEGLVLDEFINQAEREIEVIQVNRTRCRIAYEMPNAGDTEAWRSLVRIGPWKFYPIA